MAYYSRSRLILSAASGATAGVAAIYLASSPSASAANAPAGSAPVVCFDRVIRNLPAGQQTCVRAPIDRRDADCRVCHTTLPTISLDAVRDEEQRSAKGRCWVTLNGGVYDVTDFLEAHPGGQTRILMVDGLDLAKFWEIYTLHDRQHIRDLLEDYRIANLSESDAARAYETTADLPSMYENDPKRPRAARGELRIATQHPWNSEPADIRELVETFYTPNDLFFVRNHNAVPNVEAGGEEEEWRLEIEANPALGIKETEFTLDELKTRFPRYDVVATLQCAGNRQEEFVTKDRPLYVAPHWRNGAIGCARWSGVRVRDVLGAAGLPVDAMALGHVDLSAEAKICNFVADDTDETGVPYAGVIPIEKAVDPFGDTILAYEMNGEPLPRDHGYPVRLLAPGTAGCRNVKWVRTISVTKAASELDSGSELDRHFAPDYEFKTEIRKGEDHLRLDQGPVIQTLPVQSIICDPLNASIVPGRRCGTDVCGVVDSVTVRGVAWSGGGRGICRVEVSGEFYFILFLQYSCITLRYIVTYIFVFQYVEYSVTG